tara:strand:+ start:1036 stop:1356 length:321 start_codon:yes stop_codon:yes gene_type:complete
LPLELRKLFPPFSSPKSPLWLRRRPDSYVFINEYGYEEEAILKHLRTISCTPLQAQQASFSFAAIFSLVADILAAVALAVTAKESSNLTGLTGLLTGGTSGTSTPP